MLPMNSELSPAGRIVVMPAKSQTHLLSLRGRSGGSFSPKSLQNNKQGFVFQSEGNLYFTRQPPVLPQECLICGV